MTSSLSVLLPSQEALLQRMQHMASYSQQLVVALGEEGAGKSTLLTALVSEQEEYNAAYVVCPMHADAAEIRRKILIQLLSDPLFDDEEPLGDTLGRFSASLSQPIHILIDDAHLLPLELWAECLLLSQKKCAGRPIAITFTSEPAKAKALYLDLGAAQRGLMAPLEIEPLELSEREALYYTLMSRSESVPYVPRDIIRSQLEQQGGKPGDVVALLELALSPGPVDKPSRAGLWKLLTVSAVTVLVTAGLWQLIEGHPAVPVAEESQRDTYTDTGLLAPFGEWRLAGYFNVRAEALRDLLKAEAAAESQRLAQQRADEALLAQAKALAQVETADIRLGEQQSTPEAEVAKVNRHTRSEVKQAAEPAPDAADSRKASQVAGNQSLTTSNTAQSSSPPSSQQEVPTSKDVQPRRTTKEAATLMPATHIQLPTTGYTLQVATVGKLDSAEVILKRLVAEPDRFLVQYRDKLVVLQGHYSSREEAEAQADRLPQRYGGGKPWVRAWKDLGSYRPIESASGGEISN